MSWEVWGDPPEAYLVKCRDCDGKGRIVADDLPADMVGFKPCTECDGSGEVEDYGQFEPDEPAYTHEDWL